MIAGQSPVAECFCIKCVTMICIATLQDSLPLQMLCCSCTFQVVSLKLRSKLEF